MGKDFNVIISIGRNYLGLKEKYKEFLRSIHTVYSLTLNKICLLTKEQGGSLRIKNIFN